MSSEKGDGFSVPLPSSLNHISSKTIISDYEVREGQIVPKKDFSNTQELKAAFISVYRIQCGISTYSEWLWPELGKHFKDFRVFAERADAPEEPKVIRCWERGKSLAELATRIEGFDPDVVYVQHEYGIFPDARFWLALLSMLEGRKVVVCFHSVYRHLDKLICEAAAQQIVVHTEPARELLLQKGVTAPISVITHGCLPPPERQKLWNLYRSKKTLVQFGFGFRYKGWERSLEIVKLLKPRHPDVFFTGLFSTPKNAGSEMEQYFQELQLKVRELGLDDNVAFVRGFQSDKVLEAFLRMNRVAIFPYRDNGEHTVMGCSGAARFTMTQGIPVVTSDVPLFHDLSCCLRSGSVEEMAKDVEMLFNSEKAYQTQVDEQDRFLNRNSWAHAAAEYARILQPSY